MKFKQIALIGIGTTLEIYDSYIVSFMLVTLNQLFFPEALRSNLTSIATFSIIFLIRPISAFFWGILGDRYGKFLVFKHALLFMAIATLSIGLLPTYAHVGVLAPLLLLSFRVIQGVSISGEFGSAVVLCYEQSSNEKKFANNGILYVFIFSGILIASAMAYAINHSGIPMDMAWRIPFIFGGVCGFIIYWIRRTFSFNEIQHREASFKLVLQNYKSLLIGACAIFIINLNWLYFSSISRILGEAFSSDDVSSISLSCSIIVLISAFIFGKYCAYRMRAKIMLTLYFAIILMYLIGIILINSAELTKAMAIFYYLESIVAGIVFACLPILIIDRLLPVIRSSIYNIANNVSTAIIVGIMPFIINSLSQNFGTHWLNYLLTINLTISLLALLSIGFLQNQVNHLRILPTI